MALLQNNRTISIRLVASVVTTFQCLTPINGFRIFNKDFVSPVYFRTDGVDPTVGGDGSFFIAPNTTKWATNLPDSSNPELRVISAGLAVDVIAEGDFAP
jgi:hypothetical protein